ncbi:hypothetical protein [Halomarina rubra]|uniref:Uncharacterized protein n=1 Tax=Halomarina rubra TaxID=2071873 RepID=A0ABD6AW56_9EURY|nr:hypothetical protein [Halomarina rubra]
MSADDRDDDLVRVVVGCDCTTTATDNRVRDPMGRISSAFFDLTREWTVERVGSLGTRGYEGPPNGATFDAVETDEGWRWRLLVAGDPVALSPETFETAERARDRGERAAPRLMWAAVTAQRP